MNWAAASIVKEEKEKTHQEFESLLKNIHFANRFRHHLIKEEAKEVKVRQHLSHLSLTNLISFFPATEWETQHATSS